jgi:aminomethyltransferase
MNDQPTDQTLARTPLYELHRELGAKLVPFAGYDMPVQYPAGILAEHLHTRTKAGLFDVSHMGQIELSGEGAAAALETLVPGDIIGLGAGRQRYTHLTNDHAGILDDLMVTNAGDRLLLIVNAACKAADLAHIDKHLAGRIAITPRPDKALLALQGPGAAAALASLAPSVAAMAFMSGAAIELDGIPCFVTRSGYTGEDGYEISVPGDKAERLARRLLSLPGVAPAGLGARDSLRLEAGLCLYGHDIDETTTPIEADLAWIVGKRRRQEGGYPGAAIVARQLQEGPPRKRVGIRPDERAPAREGTLIVTADGSEIGRVTSGGFGPSVDGPVAMGYIAAPHAAIGTRIGLMVRGTARPATIVKLPFVPARYFKP